MAFCPHCGKSVAEQAVKCLSCGGELESKAKAARFKGTMIMQPTAAPAAAAAPAPAPAPVAAPAPAPAVAAPAPAPALGAAKAAPSKAKHTMIGTGGAGLGPAMLADFKKVQAAVAASTPPPPAGAASVPGDSAARLTDPALADTARDPKSNAPAAVSAPPRAADAPRMLAGDPMADDDGLEPGRRFGVRTGNVVPGASNKPVIVIAVLGVVVIAIAGYVAARLLGLVG
jgi:hypothetical protein